MHGRVAFFGVHFSRKLYEGRSNSVHGFTCVAFLLFYRNYSEKEMYQSAKQNWKCQKNGVEKSEIERGGGAIIHGAMNRELSHTRHMCLLLIFVFCLPLSFLARV